MNSEIKTGIVLRWSESFVDCDGLRWFLYWPVYVYINEKGEIINEVPGAMKVQAGPFFSMSHMLDFKNKLQKAWEEGL